MNPREEEIFLETQVAPPGLLSFLTGGVEAIPYPSFPPGITGRRLLQVRLDPSLFI